MNESFQVGWCNTFDLRGRWFWFYHSGCLTLCSSDKYLLPCISHLVRIFSLKWSSEYLPKRPKSSFSKVPANLTMQLPKQSAYITRPLLKSIANTVKGRLITRLSKGRVTCSNACLGTSVSASEHLPPWKLPAYPPQMQAIPAHERPNRASQPWWGRSVDMYTLFEAIAH